ncbi:MAG TPA: LysR substrate-binding domain-containing protein [Armatimonadota bacterium]|jgi:DNA-binding transcriptional LysR family regulator
MELRHLRYFLAVAEELHFGRAAKRLFMAQPPLSQQIRQLESEIGTPLFARTSRRVQLTDAGKAFLTDTQDILDRVDRAGERARRVGRGEAGWLGIGFVSSAIYSHLPEILREFRERYPDVELELMEILGRDQNQALRERRIHVGFSRLGVAEGGIVLESVMNEPLMGALPSLHPLARQDSVSLAEIASQPIILFPHRRDSRYAEFILELCTQSGVPPRVVQETGELQTAVSLVAAGIGIALVPAAARNLHREGVVYRPLAPPVPTVDLSVTYRADETSPVLPRFLRIVREIVG